MTKRKKINKNNSADPKESPDRYLLHYLKSHQGSTFSKTEVLKKMLKKYNLEVAELAIQILIAQKKLEAVPGNKLKLVVSVKGKNVVEGRIDMTRTGSAFLISPQLEKDAFISGKNLNTALDGDLVRVNITKAAPRPEGEVIEVIKRNKVQFIGTLEVSENFAFLVPINETMPVDIFIPKHALGEGKHGMKALVEIVKWEPGMKNPQGVIKTLIGDSGTSEIEMQSILLDNGFSLSFTDEVIAESEAITDVISKEEIAKRLDYRNITTFTIDPIDAKDFDDALSIQKLPNGNWEIGVHIADVSHFVKPGTALDKEAFERATSVYLPDRVCPMFPERLSNFICSLRPDEEKCTFSVIFEFDHRNKIKTYSFGKSVIKSCRRFSYEEVQEIIEKGEGEYIDEIKQLNLVAHSLRKERYSKGSVNFEAPEVRFRLDEKGKPVDVYVKERKDAHMLVEDFMLLANKTVAMYVSKLRTNKRSYPMVFRVHDTPDMTKLETFALVAKRFGYSLKFEDPDQVSGALNEFFKLVKGKPEQNILEQLAIRSMAKAIYTTNNIGHYGLGFEYYTHFTSPIRRYPDVLAHRILEECLESVNPPLSADDLEEQCEHCSVNERNALTAEREATKYKQCEYLEERIGKDFVGIISGIVASGIFVELKENKCEGFIPSLNLGYDQFYFHEEQYAMVGKKTGKSFQLGDTIDVIVKSVSLSKRQIEFELAEEVEL
jgi:ribonuclease R